MEHKTSENIKNTKFEEKRKYSQNNYVIICNGNLTEKESNDIMKEYL